MQEATVRRAAADEVSLLSDIAYRSKAYWGYDESYMELARQQLTVTERHLSIDWVFVLESGGVIRGFYELKENSSDEAELKWLFVAPDSMGKGYGKLLMNHAIRLAVDHRFSRIRVNSDPHAAGFYKSLGAFAAGESPSTVKADMKLPVLQLNLYRESP